jgi:acyl-CoA reductase-like NAD-dependent aldehyde dehydrogenase
LPAAARGDLLYKLASLIERDQELIAGIDALDNGKVSDY